jgi:hypothetical protein
MTTYIWRWAHNIRNLLRQTSSHKAVSAGLNTDPEHNRWIDKVKKELR